MTRSDMRAAIVPAEERHLPEIEAIERICFSMPWTREMLRSQMERENHIFLVAERDGGSVAGYMGLQFVLDEGYISNVAVAPDCRRHGIARALIAAMTEAARTRDLAFLTLEVREHNAAAIALYRSAGFAEVGRGKNYYEKPREDAILMTLYLK